MIPTRKKIIKLSGSFIVFFIAITTIFFLNIQQIFRIETVSSIQNGHAPVARNAAVEGPPDAFGIPGAEASTVDESVSAVVAAEKKPKAMKLDPKKMKAQSERKADTTPVVLTRQQFYRPIPSRPNGIKKGIIKAGDFIYYKNGRQWNSAPIVIESHKLIFFTIPKVGCTVWKQLFRRMMGLPDWKEQREDPDIPHDPRANGLKYLYDYSIDEASVMMTSREWTRAIMVRDPKLRMLSVFLDKSVSNDHKHIRIRCCESKACVERAQTIPGFINLIKVCDDEHWRPQSTRLDDKYWSYIDFVGHMENSAADAEKLLKKIGAWEEFGKSGWGPNGNSSIFESKETTGAGVHATWAQYQVWKWYTPEVEELVERFYMNDYENPLFNFTRGNCLTCIDEAAQAS